MKLPNWRDPKECEEYYRRQLKIDKVVDRILFTLFILVPIVLLICAICG